MFFDIADVSSLLQDDSFYHVVLHEMAHVFGFGTIWDWGYDLIERQGGNVYYTGRFGMAAAMKMNSLLHPIVENEGGTFHLALVTSVYTHTHTLICFA